jgi:2-polyprenyl-3-methyl-5-hydroxy-6-metoxy-1,4-benzoquinol methylase
MTPQPTAAGEALRTADSFGRTMFGALDGAALTLMASVGHRTGLFDVMAATGAAPATLIAREAGLSERYVCAWLAAMVAGGVVDHDASTGNYWLPTEHAAWLTRTAGPWNAAIAAQWVTVLGSVEDHVVEAFGHGRGVPPSAYRRFHEVMAQDSGRRVAPRLVSNVLPLVPGLTGRLHEGIDVLDLGCGAGGAVVAMASAFRRSRFTGFDVAPDAVHTARAEASRRGLRNAQFAARDAAHPFDRHAFDLVMALESIREQAQPGRVLANVAAALRRGGTLLMSDVCVSGGDTDHGGPLETFLRTMSCMRCLPVSLATGGPGLPSTWGRADAFDLLREAGFSGIRVERLPDDPVNQYFIAIPSA